MLRRHRLARHALQDLDDILDDVQRALKCLTDGSVSRQTSGAWAAPGSVPRGVAALHCMRGSNMERRPPTQTKFMAGSKIFDAGWPGSNSVGRGLRRYSDSTHRSEG
jgi:hypothetical protein